MAGGIVKQQLRKVDFLRYAVAPRLRRVQHHWNKLKADRVDFNYIEDLKAEAASRGWVYTAVSPAVVQCSVPSKTIPEDTLEIIQHAKRLVSSHCRRREGLDRMYLLWYAHLLSVTRHPVYETFTCDIPDVFIGVPNGEVITSNFDAITQSSRLNWDDVIMDSVPDRGSRLAGRCVSLMGWSGNDYGHWMIDILPRVSLVQDQIGDFLFVVSENLQPFKLESLELLGISRRQLVPLAAGWHRLERILVCHAAQRYMIPKRQHVSDLRDRLVKGVFGSEGLPAPWRRVYVSRNKSRRKILNEHEILPVLQEYGFERRFCEDMTFGDQVRLFAETEVMLGSHGAGMNNDVLCQPGAKVIELYNPVRWNYCVRGVANIMGHEHWFMFGRNASPDYDMTVDPKRLEKLLAYVFERGDVVEPDY
jgi:capsular polysaccharide biosynthesis protein